MNTYINLLPPEYQRQRLIRRRLKQWAVVLCGMLSLCGSIWLLQSTQIEIARQTLRQRQLKYRPTKRLLAAIPQMKNEMQELSQRDRIVAQLHDSHPPLVAVGLVSQSAAQCRHSVHVHQLVLDRPATKPQPPNGNEADTPPKPSIMSIQGAGDDNLAVARFVYYLRHTNAFARVDLKSSVRSRFATSDVQRFIVECEY